MSRHLADYTGRASPVFRWVCRLRGHEPIWGECALGREGYGVCVSLCRTCQHEARCWVCGQLVRGRPVAWRL